MTRTTARALVLLGSLLIALMPVNAASAATDPPGEGSWGASPAALAAMARSQFTGGSRATGSHAAAAKEGSVSIDDPTGDAKPPNPRADITSASVTYDPATTFSVHIDLVEPTDPGTDAGWNGNTGAIWAL